MYTKLITSKVQTEFLTECEMGLQWTILYACDYRAYLSFYLST